MSTTRRVEVLERRADKHDAALVEIIRKGIGHDKRIQALEDILIKAGILVEVKDPPAAVSDITIGRNVRNTGPFSAFGPPTVLENKKYAVVEPVKKKA